MTMEVVNELGDIRAAVVKKRQPIERIRPLRIRVSLKNSTYFMDNLTEETGQLNPYAKTFFSLWGLIVLGIVCFKQMDPSTTKLTIARQLTEQTVMRDKAPVQLGPLVTQQNWLRLGATEK